jgi:hypothetical protein
MTIVRETRKNVFTEPLPRLSLACRSFHPGNLIFFRRWGLRAPSLKYTHLEAAGFQMAFPAPTGRELRIGSHRS